MSIFNSSFPETIQNELYARQNNLLNRSNSNINSLIQPTAWIRMTSGVNTLKDDALKSDETKEYLDSDFDNTLAKQNVLSSILGGNENPQGDFIKGYTTKNRHGIRPLPGITGLDCQSFSANGSLRKVSIKFNCWDNSQLEIMEQLYMRPGYLICVEWGWTQELSTGKKLQLPKFGEKFLESGGEFQNKTLMQLYEIANNEVQSVNGNYDICLGKVQNFNWQLRKDNGYDCEVTIITYGEILDSWKINNIDLDTNISQKGIPLGDNSINLDSLGVSKYTEGKLCGILGDLNKYASAKFYAYQAAPVAFKVNLPNVGDINMYASDFSNDIIQTSDVVLSKATKGISTYITLGSLCDILNYYMLNSNLLKLSTFESASFACQAHPFQLPCDPNICLIKPQGWIDGFAFDQSREETFKVLPGKAPSVDISNKVLALIGNQNTELIYKSFLEILEKELTTNNLETSLNNIQQYIEYNIDIQKTVNNGDGTLNLKFKGSNKNYITKLDSNNNQTINLYDFLKLDKNTRIGFIQQDILPIAGTKNLVLFSDLITSKSTVSDGLFDYAKLTYPNVIKAFTQKIFPQNRWEINIMDNFESLNSLINKDRTFSQNTIDSFRPKQLEDVSKVLKNRFKDLEPFFIDPVNNNYRKGDISNIYLNLNFLYSLVKPREVNDDKNNKNEISLNAFIKDILSRVQNSIGSMNAFEIYADPIDNIAKIIDKDFVESQSVIPFLFDVDFNKSFITNHDIKSQIFPEQGTMVAISTQASSGKLGLNNKGLINYNIKTRNRFVNITSPSDSNTKIDTNFDVLDINNPFYLAVSQLSFYTSILKFRDDGNSENANNVNLTSLNNSLRDLIVYWDNKHSEDAYQSMPIPIVVGLEFPGIAGIRIGNIFSVEGGPRNILPASFGNDLDFLVRNIGQTISNNVWNIKIEGYPFKKNSNYDKVNKHIK